MWQYYDKIVSKAVEIDISRLCNEIVTGIYHVRGKDILLTRMYIILYKVR